MPEDVWVFVGSGTPIVLAKGENGECFEEPDGGNHRDAVIATANGGLWDGGDWGDF